MPKFEIKIVEKYTTGIGGMFQTKSQFSEFNIIETDFCFMHI